MAVLDLLIIALYFAVVIGAGIWYRTRAAEDLTSYFLGGNRMNWLALAMSGSVSTFDITGTMWMVSILYVAGMRSFWNHWMWGFMLPAFGLAYIAIWVRRSGVMTGAEWMVTRFGTARGGQFARTAYALLAVITQASMIGFTFQGIGTFGTVYVPLEQLAAWMPWAEAFLTTYQAETLALLIFFLTTVYVVMGGLFGVVVTDVIQTVVLTGAGLFIAGVAFTELSPEAVARAVPSGWSRLTPTWSVANLGEAATATYELFGALVIVWVLKGFFLNAGGPGQMFDFQRYLAARDERDAAKLAAAWPFFLVIRWAMVAGMTLLALAGISNITDPESVMPLVLREYLPVGIRGLVIAGLLASFMSTFSSTANSGASYLIRDIWQPHFENEEQTDEGRLIRYSYYATVAMVLMGIAIGFQADSLSQIFDWIMMALGAGVVMPNFLRWHWWRLNGWGYGAGTVGGIVLSLIVLLFPSAPPFLTFPIILGGSLLASVGISLATAPTHPDVLVDFFESVRPFGFWEPVRADADPQPPEQEDCTDSPRRIAWNTLVAIVGVYGLYLAPMYLVGHWYTKATLWAGASLVASVVLYFTWYRHLPPARPPADPETEPEIASERT